MILIDNPSTYLIALNSKRIESAINWLKCYRVSYYGKAIELLIFRPSELIPQFYTLLYRQGKFSNYIAPLTSTKENQIMPSTKTTKTKTTVQVADEIKAAAMKKAETAVAKGENVKKKIFETKVYSIKELMALESNKKVIPIKFDDLRECILEEYLDTYDRVVGEIDAYNEDPSDENRPIPAIVEAGVTGNFLSMWIKANGKNRESKPEHVLKLKDQFQDQENHGFDSSCTHFVLTREGLVGNGGHSGKALALAFFPSEEIDPDAWAQVPQDSLQESQTVESSLTWKEAYGDRLKVQLSIGADPSAVLKMDDLRLEASDVDYIQLIDWLSQLARLYKIKLSDLSTWSRACALRYRGPTVTTKTEGTGDDAKKVDYITYGYLSKSGRANPAIAPVRVLTFGMDCIENLLLIRKANGKPEGTDATIVAPQWPANAASKIPYKDILVAMFGMDDTQKQRLVDGIFGATGELAPHFGALYVKPVKESYGWSAPKADRAVQICINYAMGMSAKDACLTADGSWHRPECRLPGWDRGEANAAGKTRQSVMIANAKIIAKHIDDESIVHVVERNEKE